MERVVRALLPLILLTACDHTEGPEPTARAETTLPVTSHVFVAPTWFPETGREALEAVEGLDAPGPDEGGPRLHAPSVLVYDVDRGEVLYEKAADQRRAIASVTKLFTALTLSAHPVDLGREVVCVTPDHYPIKPGAMSRLVTNSCYRGWDLVGAALVRSDNRAAMTFMTLAGYDMPEFVERMDEVARELGATRSTFQDPAGIGDDNLSTARDVTRAVVAVAAHPLLSVVASAPVWRIETTDGARVHTLTTTDFLADRPDVQVFAAKTGYTDPARYCFAAMVLTSTGTRIAFALLGNERSAWRQSDALDVIRWVEDRDRALADTDAVRGTAGTP